MTTFAPGDIVEIDLPNGWGYVQVTHMHPSYSEVVRAFPTVYSTKPDLELVVRQKPKFVAMIPLSGAVDAGTIAGRKVGNAPIPEADRSFPTFKMAIRDKKEGVRGDVAYWWFWDGDGLTYDSNPGPETKDYPLREVMSAKQFIEKINDGSMAAA